VAAKLRALFKQAVADSFRAGAIARHVAPGGERLVSLADVAGEMPFLVSDEPVIIVFGSDESFTNSLSQVAMEFETKTTIYWKQWCNNLCLPVEFQQVLMRAAMTLAMNQSEDCGGFLATLSMGLPLG
ncbi:hypothetical protein AK812_SmicGene46301, partial [Symbiodinium microadriaticum]